VGGPHFWGSIQASYADSSGSIFNGQDEDLIIWPLGPSAGLRRVGRRPCLLRFPRLFNEQGEDLVFDTFRASSLDSLSSGIPSADGPKVASPTLGWVFKRSGCGSSSDRYWFWNSIKMRTIGEREPDVPRAQAEAVSSSWRGSKLRYCLSTCPCFSIYCIRQRQGMLRGSKACNPRRKGNMEIMFYYLLL